MRRASGITRRRPSRAALASWVLVAVWASGAAGCGLGQDRVTQHLSRAAELEAEGRGREAVLELRAAAQLAPDDHVISLRVAEAAAQYGMLDEAISYYADAHALDPDDDETALALARLLIQEDPERSDGLVAEVLARTPDHPGAILVQAESKLAANDLPAARQLVERAQRLAPDDPEVYWALAHVHEARVRAIRARAGGAVRDQRSLDPILDAYETYVEKGGTRRVMAALGKARALGSWGGLAPQAHEAYMRAIGLALDEGTLLEKIQVMRAAAGYADGVGDTDLERTALETWVDLTPDAFSTWEQLANVRAADGSDASEATFARMIERNPENAAAHVVFAMRIGRTRGYGAAVEYLESRVGQGMDDVVLLTGLVNLQHAHRHPLDAARTLERIQREYPDRPATALLVARQQLSENAFDAAVATLEAAVAEHPSVEAWRLLAQAELQRQHNQDAMVAVEQAIALTGGRDPDNIRLKARVHMALGESRKAAMALSRMSRIEPLTPDDRLMMARAYYTSHGAIHGRRILESMLTGNDPHPKAALELARWEMENPNRQAAVRTHLRRVHKRYPANGAILEALTRDDLTNGRERAALARVTRAIAKKPKNARLYLTRARVFLAMGRAGDAVRDTRRAVALSPVVNDDAHELLATLYLSWPDPSEPIRNLEKLDAEGAASPDDIALLARLVLQSGDREKARALYERALAEGSDLALLKNDLAYLLADSGEDLDRALQLAREAANAPTESLAAADTLGFVYLQSGQYDAAFWQFRFVTEEASPPVAEYYYHLGLALMKLERRTAARNALAEALRIEPGYAAAENALRELDGGTHDVGAAHPQPS